MSATADPHLVFALMFAVFLGACGDGPRFDVKVAPTFGERRTAVSVIGVYRDGRMDTDAWGRLGFASGLAVLPCPPAFSESLRSSDPESFAAIDEEARSNGITDELLERLASKARGDSMLLIVMHGHAQAPTKPGAQARAMPPSPSSGHGAHRGPGSFGPESGPRGDLEVSALWYSVPRHELLATLTMKYGGADADTAFAELTRRLGVLAPQGSTCGGWAFDRDPSQASSPVRGH